MNQAPMRALANMMRFKLRLIPGWLPVLGLLLVSGGSSALAVEASESTRPPAAAVPVKSLDAVVPPERWRQVEAAVDRGLAWLASQQAEDGSFPSIPRGQPAVTSLGVMAFLSRGHQPGVGPYGEQLNRAIDYVLSCQMPDGAFSKLAPEPSSGQGFGQIARAGGYNHPFAGLMLGEVYGQVTGERERKVKAAIQKALQFSRALQTRTKPSGLEGGFRYLNMDSSDLSVTACQLMFLRSAKNAEFDVSQQYVDEALAYVHRSGDVNTGVFQYTLPAPSRGRAGGQSATNLGGVVTVLTNRGRGGVSGNPGRGVIGGGIVALSMGGEHQSDLALAAGEYLLAHPVTTFGEVKGYQEEFFYTAYYCSQAAALLGGKYWQGIFPRLAGAVMDGQQPDGSWPPEAVGVAMYGNALTTAFAVLALTPPYQLLPIYQR